MNEKRDLSEGRVAFCSLCSSYANTARGNDGNASRKISQFIRSEDFGKQVKNGANAVFVGTKEQEACMCAWRIFAYIGEAFVGCNEKSIFLLNNFPERRVFPSTHLLVNHADRVVVVLAQKSHSSARQIFVHFDGKDHEKLSCQRK